MAGTYRSSRLRLNPQSFNVTGEMVLSVPLDACGRLQINATGKIVFALSSTVCAPTDKAQNVQDAGGIGIVIANTGSANSHTGYLYYW